MIQDTVQRLEARLADGSLPADKRAELLALVAQLKAELDSLSETHPDAARSIAGFTDVSAHEATRDTPNTALVDLSLRGLQQSVLGLEESNPKLAAAVNAVAVALSNFGF
jgi:hypothetical protein